MSFDIATRGRMVLWGKGTGRGPTARAVFGDILATASNPAHGGAVQVATGGLRP